MKILKQRMRKQENIEFKTAAYTFFISIIFCTAKVPQDTKKNILPMRNKKRCKSERILNIVLRF